MSEHLHRDAGECRLDGAAAAHRAAAAARAAARRRARCRPATGAPVLTNPTPAGVPGPPIGSPGGVPPTNPPVPAGTSPVPGLIPSATPPQTPPAGTQALPGAPGVPPPAGTQPVAGTTPPARDLPAGTPAPPAGAPPAPSTAAQIIVTPPGEFRVAGGPYTVPISVNNASRISVITLSVTYNPAVLRVRTVSDGTFMRQGGVTASFAPRPDRTPDASTSRSHAAATRRAPRARACSPRCCSTPSRPGRARLR